MANDVKQTFETKLKTMIGNKYSLRWDTDDKGVVCGWCQLTNPEDIISAAKVVASFQGRVMTISPLVATNVKPEHAEANYHFYFEGVNCTVRIILRQGKREVKSITPILKSADWHEREMQELFNIKLIGHPNPQRLFLDSSIHMTDRTMIPLSEAMNGASSSTLWERIMESKNKEADTGE